MKNVATIIVTYNGERWIRKCLQTILESSHPSDIFVVDNCSTDSTVSIIEEFPVNFERLDFNAGFGFANNVVLKKLIAVDYEYFFLINQDLYVQKNTLAKLIDFAEKNPTTGIIAPIQYNGDGSEIDTNFRQYINLSQDHGSFYETGFCNAAAWLVKKNCLQKLGFFNENFKHYGEDRNYCERTKFHGFKIAIVKETKVLHDRIQKMTPEKALNLAKIKLLTIFLDPNKSKS